MHHAIFFNKILSEIKTFSNFLSPLTHQVKDLKPFYCRMPYMEFYFYKDDHDMFYTTFRIGCHWIIQFGIENVFSFNSFFHA